MGGFLTIGCCLRTIGYCFAYRFQEIFVGGQSRDRGISPLEKTLILVLEESKFFLFVNSVYFLCGKMLRPRSCSTDRACIVSDGDNKNGYCAHAG